MSDTQTSQSGSTPAPKRSGLTILLWIVLLIIVGGGLYGMSLLRKVEQNPSVKAAIAAYENLIKDMETKTQAQIEQEGEHISATDLLASPETVRGRYVVVDGEIQGEESAMVNQNMVAANMTVENLQGDIKGYLLDEGLVLVDITGEGGTYKDKDLVRGFGAVMVVELKDVWELPIVGPDLKREFGDIEGTADKVVFLFSKGVKQITPEEMIKPGGGAAPGDATAPPTSPTSDGAADAATPPADGAVPPADGAAPPADSTTPPAEGSSPPAEGATPPAGG